MLMQILLLRGHSSPYVPLRFIDIQHNPGLSGKSRIDMQETFCHIFMYRTFADSKFFRSLAHSRIIVNDIIGNADGALFNIILQGLPP